MGEGNDPPRGVPPSEGQSYARALLTALLRFSRTIRKGVAVTATAKPELLARVAEHKQLFFNSSWAKYAEATRGTLRIAAPEERVNALRADYSKMQQMFFGTPPEFDSMMAQLEVWERGFNQR